MRIAVDFCLENVDDERDEQRNDPQRRLMSHYGRDDDKNRSDSHRYDFFEKSAAEKSGHGNDNE